VAVRGRMARRASRVRVPRALPFQFSRPVLTSTSKVEKQLGGPPRPLVRLLPIPLLLTMLFVQPTEGICL
jgi:hypothetical protein